MSKKPIKPTQEHHPDLLPTQAQLLKSTAVAAAIAGVLLVTTVLPAEYGIDPTGIGRQLGLTALSQPGPALIASAEAAPLELGDAAAGVPSALDAVWKSSNAYRSDQLSLVLQPGEGAEIKASMKAGERFVFNWTAAGGAVNFDMHGEELHAAKDAYTSYWRGKEQTHGQGAFAAPFDGTHGWYWRNRGAKPVTVSVSTSGFYEKLFRP
ncbi:MAG: hypothetical protein AB7N91_29185 [Candidatus Tectimicrobiota bacterium]